MCSFRNSPYTNSDTGISINMFLEVEHRDTSRAQLFCPQGKLFQKFKIFETFFYWNIRSAFNDIRNRNGGQCYG